MLSYISRIWKVAGTTTWKLFELDGDIGTAGVWSGLEVIYNIDGLVKLSSMHWLPYKWIWRVQRYDDIAQTVL